MKCRERITPQPARRSYEQEPTVTASPFLPILEHYAPRASAQLQGAERLRLPNRRPAGDNRRQTRLRCPRPAVPGTNRAPPSLQIELGIKKLEPANAVREHRQRFLRAIGTGAAARKRTVSDRGAQQHRQRDNQNQISREQQHALTTPDLASIPCIRMGIHRHIPRQ